MKKKIVFLAGMLLALPLYVSASTYKIDFKFKVGLTSSVRSFSGSDISVYTNSSADSSQLKNFQVTLERIHKSFFGTNYDFIGTVNHPRNGSKTTEWTNVGSGKYIVEFSKANDGIYVDGYGKFYN